MRKSKKQLLRALIACGLVVSVAAGGTVAYLTDAETATNTFTVGKVKIDLEEPGYPGNDSDEVKNIIPNQEIVKDPQIENTGNNDALVFIRVEIPQETFTDEDDGTGEQKKQDLFRLKGVSDQWELLRTETVAGEDGKAKTSYVYGYKKPLGKGATTDKLFRKVQMKNAVESDLSGNVEDIVVTACAIQATDIPDVSLTPGSDGNLSKDVLDQVYTIFLNQSGNQTSRPADEGDRNQSGKLGKISYELDGGTLAAGTLTEYGSADYGYTPPAPAKKNYTFTGWEPENIPAGSTGKVTLVAKWTPTVLGSISYNLNGGSMIDKKTAYTVEDYGYTPPAPTKENYTFDGWSPASIPSGSTGTVTMTAKWTADVLGSISYNLDGGNISGEKASYTADDYGYIPPTPTKTGYKFTGWSPAKIQTDSTGNVTFAASWEEETATTLDGETLNARMKVLAGKKNADCYKVDTKITAIQHSIQEPSDEIKTNPTSLVSTEDSEVPVYMWFEDGTIKWWSAANSVVANSNLNYLCYYMTNLIDISGLSDLDTKDVTSMRSTFSACNNLTDLTALKRWDTRNLTDVSCIFSRCTSLSDLTPLASWNTNNITNMGDMFKECINLLNLNPLTNWNTSNVTSMNNMFFQCASLASLTPIANWDTDNLTTMSDMFYECTSLVNLTPLTNWNTEKVVNMNGIFDSCSGIVDLSPLASWNTGSVTTMSYMFSGCTKLANPSAINTWDISSVTAFKYMFRNCPSHPIFTKRAGTWDRSGTFNPTA